MFYTESIAMLEDTFADIIAKARFGKGLSLFQVAAQSHLFAARVSLLEQGADLTTTEVDSLARALGLDPGKLRQIAQLAWHPQERTSQWDLAFIQRIDGRMGDYPVNGYIFADSVTKEAVLFDTGVSPNQVIQALRREGLKLVAICITHAHPDHLGGGHEIRRATAAPLYLHLKEVSSGSKEGITFLKDGMEIPVGRFLIRPLTTPGHTPGGITYFIDGRNFALPPMAFVGDALFAGSLGRASSSATYATLLHSVQSKILTLPEKTHLYPGHGPASTVGEERLHNPFFTIHDATVPS